MPANRIATAPIDEPVTVVFASNANYAPLLSVAIQSIVCNASDRQYEICVLYTSMAVSHMRKLQGIARENISIRFFPVADIADKMHLLNLHVSRHITVETYLRFIIPELFQNRKKVLYIDCDVVATRDVAELFDLPLNSDTYLAAAHDTYILYLLGKGDIYFSETLGMCSPRDYFQAGVLLLNLDAFRQHHLIEKIYTTLERITTPRFVDQDILNVVCEGHVLFLDGRWNVEYHMPLCTRDYEEILTPAELEEYKKCYTDPWILHFCGIRKPWANPSYFLSEIFWQYARMSPFYEEIFYSNMETNAEKAINKEIRGVTKSIESVKKHVQTLQGIVEKNDAKRSNELKKLQKVVNEIAQLGDYRRKLKRIRWKIHLSWGGRKQRYLARKRQLKENILFIERFIKTK